MKKQLTDTDRAFAELRNLSEYSGALKAGLAFKKMIMEDDTMNPEFKIRMIQSIDDVLEHLTPAGDSELSEVTVGDVIDKMENNVMI